MPKEQRQQLANVIYLLYTDIGVAMIARVLALAPWAAK
jgi:hypothetical protein